MTKRDPMDGWNGWIPEPPGPAELLPDIGKSMCDPRDCMTTCTACDEHAPLPEHARKVLDAAQDRIAKLEAQLARKLEYSKTRNPTLEQAIINIMDVYGLPEPILNHPDTFEFAFAVEEKLYQLTTALDAARRELCQQHARTTPITRQEEGESLDEYLAMESESYAGVRGWSYLYEEKK